MSVTLRQLELFVALANHSTLSAAAAELHVSESALSSAISQLERGVGAQLCVRRKARGVTLTPTGHIFAARAAAILSEMRELVNDVAAQEGEIVGEVRIGCFTTLAGTVLPPVMQHIPLEHPGLRITVSIGTQEELLSQLDTGRLDFAILYDQYLPDHLRKAPIYQAEEMALLPESHALAGRDSISLKELADEPLVLLDATPSVPNMRHLYAEQGLTPRIVAAVPEIGLVRALVGRGVGYGVLMSRPSGVETTIDGHRIIFKPLRPRRPSTNVVAVWQADVSQTSRARRVVEFAQAWFREPPEATPISSQPNF